MLASGPVKLSGIRVSSPTTLVGRFLAGGNHRFVAWSFSDGDLLATEDFDPFLFAPPPALQGLPEILAKALLRKEPPPPPLVAAAAPTRAEGRSAATGASPKSAETEGEAAPPWVRNFGEWKVFAAAEAEGLRTLVLCRGENDAELLRIRREKSDGTLVADRTLEFGHQNRGSSEYYNSIEDATFGADGSVLLLLGEEGRAAAAVRVAADLSSAGLARLEVESSYPSAANSSILLFDPTRREHPDRTFEEVFLDGGASKAFRLSWTYNGADHSYQVSFGGATPTALFFGLQLNIRSDPESSAEELAALAVFDRKGRSRANLLLTGGEDEETDFDSPSAWDLRDGTTIFVMRYRAIQPVTRQMSPRALRVLSLDSRNRLSSLLLPSPSALAGLPEEESLLSIDPAGITLRKKDKYGDEALLGEPSLRLLWKKTALGEPDPRLGFEAPRLAKGAGSAGLRGARIIWPATAGGYATLGSDASDSQLFEYDPGEPPLVLPGPVGPGPIKERRRPDYSDHGWIDLQVSELPLKGSSIRLRDTEHALASIPRLALQAAPRRGPLSGDLAFLNDSKVRVRAAPSTSAPILAQLDRDAVVLVLERGATTETIGGLTAPWFKVQLTDGRIGWIFSAFLDPLQKVSP